jgi:hypothetical protein
MRLTIKQTTQKRIKFRKNDFRNDKVRRNEKWKEAIPNIFARCKSKSPAPAYQPLKKAEVCSGL